MHVSATPRKNFAYLEIVPRPIVISVENTMHFSFKKSVILPVLYNTTLRRNLIFKDKILSQLKFFGTADPTGGAAVCVSELARFTQIKSKAGLRTSPQQVRTSPQQVLLTRAISI